jgi:hypothetical protein
MNGNRWPRFLAIGATVVMAGAVIAGIVVLGSPAHQRSLQLDQRRVTDMNVIGSFIATYWQQHHALPASLDALELPQKSRQDPVTNKPYDYVVTGERSYRLCARFDLPSSPEAATQLWLGNLQNHPSGQHCADRVVGSH